MLLINQNKCDNDAAKDRIVWRPGEPRDAGHLREVGCRQGPAEGGCVLPQKHPLRSWLPE